MSPDLEFSYTGGISGIQYKAAFINYRKYLSKGTTTAENVISYYTRELFGSRARKTTSAATSGTIDSEFDELWRELDQHTANPVAKEVPPPLSSRKSLSQLEEQEPITPAPASESEHHISISVTSSVLHTVATSSRVSHITNNNNPPVPEHDAKEFSPPPSPKASKSIRNKKAQKASKSSETVNAPSSDPDDAPATKKRGSSKQGKTRPTTAPSERSLRQRK